MTEQSATTKRKPTDRDRLMAWLDEAMRRRPVQILLTGAIFAVLSVLIGPGFSADDSLLDELKIGEPAPSSIKATRRFSLPPSKTLLERKRAQAAKDVLPVFDYLADRGATLLSRVNRAFEAVTTVERVEPGAEERRPSPAELRNRFVAALEHEVSPEIFDLFRDAGFSAELRAAVVVLVGSATEKLLVSHPSVLEPFKGRPIIVRPVIAGRATARGEERLDNFNRIKDIQQIKQSIRVQVNVYGAKLKPRVRDAVATLVQDLVIANVNLRFNRAETERRTQAARASVQGKPRVFAKGEVIIRDGEPVTREHSRIIASMESYRGVRRVQVTLIGIALLVTIVLVVFHRFASHHFRGLQLRPRDLLAMGVIAIGLLGVARGAHALAGATGALPGEARLFPYVLPIAAGAMLVRLLINAEAAALFAVLLAAFAGLMFQRAAGLELAFYYLVTGLVGAAGMAKVHSRSTVLRAGMLSSLAGAGAALATCMISGNLELGTVLYSILLASAGGFCAAFVTLALLPALEWLFAYTTDVTLLELANLNHPLLRDLMIRAPGTYHHSMVVGNLSEAGCEAIGGNALLAHVAGYFHDVGKMRNSVYFGENIKTADNPHNRLKPSMSALIIRNHHRHSVEMLREHRLPQLVIDTSCQHHGTTLIEFFYHKAKESAEEGEEIREEDYRYPGPKPQSREAGVLMLADGVEAAARSLPDPSEDRLRAVVQRVINAKFADGQLDHCDLTLRDLHLIAKSFLQVLRGIYHQRPTYPWQQKEKADEKAAEGRRGKGEERERKTSKPHDKASKSDGAKGKTSPGDADAEAGRADSRSAKSAAAGERGDPTGRGLKDAGGGGDGEPEGGRQGGEVSEQTGPHEAAKEGNTDIKRLGLN